jgi:hypothetical protein
MNSRDRYRATFSVAQAIASFALMFPAGCGGQYADRGTVDLESAVKAGAAKPARGKGTKPQAAKPGGRLSGSGLDDAGLQGK